MNLKKIIAITTLSTIGIISKGQNTEFLIKIPYNLHSKGLIIEPTAEYKLPLGIQGFTFVDLYKEGYFGQTDLTKTVGRINIRSRTIHNNELHTKTGIGINKDIELFNEKLYVSASILPLWFDNKGFIKRQTADYFFSLKLGENWSLDGFGEWELTKGKIRWVYGELDLGKDLDKFRLSYSPTINKNKFSKGVNIDHRVAASYTF